MSKYHQVSFVAHLGHEAHPKKRGKSYIICTLAQLRRVEKHNNHHYNEEEVQRLQSDIDLSLKHHNRHFVIKEGKCCQIEGYLPIADNVKAIYERLEMLNIQEGGPPQEAKNYFKKLQKHKKRQIAAEAILQIGDCFDWQGLPLERRFAMAEILLDTLLKIIQKLNENNKNCFLLIGGISIHLCEATPHLHVVGVPIEYNPNAKDGLKYRVKKTAIFNLDTLGPILQDYGREISEDVVREEFGWEFKPKEIGRNDDFDKMTYIRFSIEREVMKYREFFKSFMICKDSRQAYEKNRQELDAQICCCKTLAIKKEELLSSIPFLCRKKVSAYCDQLWEQLEADASCMQQASANLTALIQLVSMNPVRESKLNRIIEEVEEKTEGRRASLAEKIRDAEKKKDEQQRNM